MLRLLLLLGLPFGVYGYWRYIAQATQEQRKQRTQAAIFGIISLVVIGLALRRGSPAVVGLAATGLAVWNLAMRYRARKAGTEPQGGNSVPPSGGGGGRSGAAGAQMTPNEALEILGLDAQASREQIQQRYRQLMQSVHPDKGGSGYLAAQINQARDVLLKGAGSRQR